MGKSGAKGTKAVRVPHDGPIYYYYQQIKQRQFINAKEYQKYTGIQEALQLLLPPEENNSVGSEVSPSVKLVQALLSAAQIRSQLHALQAYRNTIIKSSSQSIQQQLQQEQKDKDDEDPVIRLGTFRLLLELAMSADASTPFRRAIHSSLEAMKSSIPADDVINMTEQVVDSVLCLSESQHPKWWKSPVRTLFEALQYRHTKQTLLVLDLSLEDADSCTSNRFIRALTLLQYVTQPLQSILEQQSLSNNPQQQDQAVPSMLDKNIVETVEQSLDVATTLKLLLTPMLSSLSKESGDEVTQTSSPSVMNTKNFQYLIGQLESFMKKVMTCRATHSDGLSIAGVTYAQTLMCAWIKIPDTEDAKTKNLPEWVSFSATRAIENILKLETTLPPLNILAMVQGIAATLPNSVLVCCSSDARDSSQSATSTTYPVPILMDPLASYLLEQCRNATDSAVRLCALRGFHTLMTRCHAILKGTISTPQSCFGKNYHQHVQELTKDALEICLATWENPPGRQVENAVPALFESIVSLVQLIQPVQDQEGGERMDCNDNYSNMDSSSIKEIQKSSSFLDALVKRILAQPPNRKGRYLALETLLPVLGSKKLLAIGGDELIESFVSGIGDRGHNAGAIADLLGKLLSRLREEMNADAGIEDYIVPRKTNKKQRRKLEREIAAARKSADGIMMVDDSSTSVCEASSPIILPEWIQTWAPHVARALLSPSPIRRRQVAAFCIPLMVTIVGGPTHRTEASYTFAALLDELNSQYEMASGIQGSKFFSCESYAVNQETISDRFLWAKLEIARQSSIQKLTTAATYTKRLHTCLAKSLPKEVVMSSLTHAMPFIRVVAFAALETVIPTYDANSTSLQNCENELAIWRFALPYAFKSGTREYISNLLKLLSSLLTRISTVESEYHETDKMNLKKIVISDEDNNDSMTIDSPEPTPLPILTSFICDFLISTITLKQAAYPGTVLEKEGFVLPLLNCIVSFASEHSDLTMDTNNKPKRKAGIVPRRRLHPSQVVTNRHIMHELLSAEVFAALLSLLDSMWDNTRAAAYELLCVLVRQAHALSIPLPSEVISSNGRRYLEARAMHLASSPRQREADTGARVLSFAYASLVLKEERMTFLGDMVKTVAGRVAMMERGLGLVLGNNSENGQGKSEQEIEDGRELPLAHGLIQALRLIVEFDRTAGNEGNLSQSEEKNVNDLFEKMALICCQSIEVSLKVVADVKEGETIDGLESEISTPKKDSCGQAPLNVNTGAIGANGMFSSVKAGDGEEERRRFAMQRVIVGSWLLTKEACAMLATTIADRRYQASSPLVERTGSLLISTLTSLKHQGAAFAAHKALQKIATSCSNCSREATIMQMPSKWTQRLLHEISSTEKVRDSTLRRSTGYGLGFLSIMRSEPPTSVAPRTLCPFILANLIKIALPPEGEMEVFMKRFDFHTPTTSTPASPFSYSGLLGSGSSRELYTADANYESRSRVHALNILRLIILDAPLAAEVANFVGDAIMASILGYNDSSWAVRNSATMVFAAAMLRVVDADKNANRKDLTSGNAITANELFRIYPVLSPFLVSVMQEGVNDMKGISITPQGAMSLRMIHPPLYPILLLLSRLQPVSGGTEEVTGPFVGIVLESLHHNHHKVRVVASRALANICSGATDRVSSRLNLLTSCTKILDLKSSGWNAVHGALLAIQALLEVCSDPESYLNSNNDLTTKLYWYASWCNESCECPPPCTAIALETLDDAARRGREVQVSSQLTEQCNKASWAVISRIEAIAAYQDSLNLIGQARLGAVASRVACNGSFDGSLQALDLAKLSRLFQSNVICVRLEAVKAFKKPIYNEIDNLLNDQSTPKDARIGALVQLGQTLLAALTNETYRSGNSYVSFSGGDVAHPPTVRRLSRCLLECAYAYKSLAKSRHDKVGFIDMIPVEECWETCLKMMNILEDDREEGQLDVDTDTSISGNAVELMGLCVCSLLMNNDTTRGGGNDNIVGKIGIFGKVTVRLNDPLSSWRLRHSAALAIETSQLIHWVAPNTISQDAQELSKTQLELYITTLKFLEDNDPDVRFVAGRVLGNLSVSPDSTRSSTSVPLLSFEKAYEYARSRFVGSTFTSILMSSVQENLLNLEEDLKVFVKETRHSEDTSKSSELLLNLSSDRKIFEEEDANPYEESLLVSHLVAYMMAHQPLSPSSPSLTSSIATENERDLVCLQQSMIKQCHTVMELIYNRMLSRTHLLHDVTRSNKMFPSIHSLLVVCIAILVQGGEDIVGLQEIAVQIVDEVSSSRKESSSTATSLLHPIIMEAIVTLANAKPKDNETLKSLVACCFLLPNLSSSIRL